MTNIRKSPDTIYHIPGMNTHQSEMSPIAPTPDSGELVAVTPVREGDDIVVEQMTEVVLPEQQLDDEVAEQTSTAPHLAEIEQLYAQPQEQQPRAIATPERVVWITGPEAAHRAHEYGSRIVHLNRRHALNASGVAA